ncbi:MAG: arylsulfotransferase family protein [Acidiferrobacterales bacterium]
MKLFQKIAVGYLLFVAVLVLGVMIGQSMWLPFSVAREIKDFIDYSAGKDNSVFEKLQSDFGGTPHRFLYEYEPLAATGMLEMKIFGLKDRRAQPLLRLSQDAPRGYRVLFGAFDFEDTFWGAVLIDSNGKVINTWHLSTDGLPLSSEPDIRKNMYGVDILADGSVIFLMQEEGGGIIKIDYCGDIVWTLDGSYHHAVSLTGEGSFWTLEGSQGAFDPILALIDVNTGKVLKRIDMRNVRAANPDTHIFDLQRQKNADHAAHGNDIDPLPKHLVAEFPQFARGDLLISYHTTNLVFVLDPNTLKIKWWRIGPWDRQHDPDWNLGGYISVFSNNQRGVGEHSNIIAIDPQTIKFENMVAGSRYEFFSRINGMHEVTNAGTILVTSTTQGRIFEVNGDGKVVFDFVNLFDADVNQTLHVSNARFLGPEFFQFEELPSCEDP